MGAQPTKERGVTTGALTARTTRSKPRLPKDGRQLGSNIFTEHSANSDNGAKLREQLKTHLPHIRVCTVSLEDFSREIVPTQVLTDSEVAQICLYHGNKDIKPALPQICDVTKPRNSAKLYEKSDLLRYSWYGRRSTCRGKTSQFSFDIITRDHTIELCALVLYKCNNISQDCTVKIQDFEESSSPISVTAPMQGPNHHTIDLSSSDDDNDDVGSVILLPSRRYRVTVSSAYALDSRCTSDPVGSGGNISCQHFSLLLTGNANGYYITCIKRIFYKILTPQ